MIQPTLGDFAPRDPTQPVSLAALRRLKWDELVSHGDFVADGHQGFAPWDGPRGFQAGMFINPIYRRRDRHFTGLRKIP